MRSPQEYQPPGWVKKLLSFFLDPRLLEASLGDLEEKYQRQYKRHVPRWKLDLRYTLEALGFLKMARVDKNSETQITINMINHTLLFFTRLVKKDKSYYLVSWLGLTVSLASFLLITMFIFDEIAYDRFHEKHKRIYRVTTRLLLNDVAYAEATSQFPAAEAIRLEIPEVEQTVRVFRSDLILESGDKKFQERIAFADERFFDIFSFPIVEGDRQRMLEEPHSVVLTEAAAKKYFGTEYPLGKTITLHNQPLIVTGVLKDIPDQSHMKFDVIIPLSWQLQQWFNESGTEGREHKWYWTGVYTYVLLRETVDPETVQKKLAGIVDKYFPDRYKADGRFQLQPLTDIHLRSNYDAEMEPGGSLLYLRLFSVVACVIMIVCTINLINLSYFKISRRTREVGVRKFLGQNASRVIAQLSIESVLMGLIAFGFAVIVCQSFLTNFNLLVRKNLSLWTETNLVIAAATLLMIIVISILSVTKPAIQYASRPAKELLLHKSMAGKSRGRNVLIALQVCFSFVLLVFSFIVSSQINFFRNKDLGFRKDHVMIIQLNDGMLQNFEAFKTELKRNQQVEAVTGAEIPGMGYNGWRFVPEGGSYEKPMLLPFTFADYDFLPVMNIRLILGENFNPKNHNDTLAPFIINKRAALELGWADDPLNKTLEVFGPGTTEIMLKGKVIGVIEDYHSESLHRPVRPLVITASSWVQTALLKLSGDPDEETLKSLETTWKKFSDRPFEYEMLEAKLAALYSNETQLSDVILFFTFIALYLTCYGMFAMSSLMFGSRLKEVAIRKVFGADHLTIIGQLYAKYAAFNAAAILIGIPVAIWIGNLWLETFQYRIDLSSALFIKAALFILMAGLISVSYYLAKVAFSNPVSFLRRD